MRNLYPRLAATNLKKNRRFYLPYLLACIVIVALFCIMLTLASDPYLGQMQHGGSVSQVLGFGVFIMALFSAIILFYTNSTFTKQRKREFAIYNILGMEKRHISYVLFWESLYTAAMALFFGLVAAGVFSKLLQLVLVRLIGGEATFGLNIRLMSIGYTVVFFGALFLLLLLNTIRIIHLSNPVQLLRAGSEGEREPRSKWILALLGAVCLAAGYLISLRTNVALYAIQNFFPAVILVIIGTYLTFIALSVVVLKALRKNRRYYYKTSHFATVSGLIYRMSRNAAGLASICILSTMVLVTVSTTVSLYKGLDAYAAVRWPQDMTLTLMTDPQTSTVPDVAPVLQVVDDTMTRAGLTQSNVHGYRTVRFSALRSGDALDLTSEQLTGSSADEYAVMVLDTEGYADLTGEQVTLAPGEALAWTDGAAFGDTLTLGGDTLRLRQLDSFCSSAAAPSWVCTHCIWSCRISTACSSCARSKTPTPASTAAPVACSTTRTSSTSPARTTSSSTRCTRFSATPRLSLLPRRRTCNTRPICAPTAIPRCAARTAAFCSSAFSSGSCSCLRRCSSSTTSRSPRAMTTAAASASCSRSA